MITIENEFLKERMKGRGENEMEKKQWQINRTVRRKKRRSGMENKKRIRAKRRTTWTRKKGNNK